MYCKNKPLILAAVQGGQKKERLGATFRYQEMLMMMPLCEYSFTSTGKKNLDIEGFFTD